MFARNFGDEIEEDEVCDLGNGWSIKADALSNIATIYPPRIGDARTSGSYAKAASFSDTGAFGIVRAYYPGGDSPATLSLENYSSKIFTNTNEIICNLLVDCCEFGAIV